MFYDPPKQNIQQGFQKIYDAGIKVKVITGDNADTYKCHCPASRYQNNSSAVNGSEITHHSETELMTFRAKPPYLPVCFRRLNYPLLIL